MKYEHTQPGYLVVLAILVALLSFSVVFVQTGVTPVMFAFMFFILFLLISFSSLNVVIDDKYLRIKFGYGIFKKKFLLREILTVKAVKNRWYYGWGIRVWFWPSMSIYNVSGFDAIEIKIKSGKTYRIGTDEPKELVVAVKRLIKVSK